MPAPVLFPRDQIMQKKVELLYGQTIVLFQNGLSADSLTMFYSVLAAQFNGFQSLSASQAQLVFEAAMDNAIVRGGN